MRLTKIICTIGPASSSKNVQKKLIISGMDVARINLSHGTFNDHLINIKQIRSISKELNKSVAILADLPGPKLRIKGIKELLVVKKGDSFSFNSGKIKSGPFVSYKNLSKDISKGKIILISEGRIRLKVTNIIGSKIETTTLIGGELGDGNGVSVLKTDLKVNAVSKNDIKLAMESAKSGVDWLAQSFIKKGSDVARLRKALSKEGFNIPIMAKIEKKEAVDNMEEIIAVSDGVMIARGDLGTEMSPEDVPIIQKKVINIAMRLGKPVVTATQMLESMIDSIAPTRAEASDVANAIFDETDAVMLSGETAIGKNPVETVTMMRKIIKKAESVIDYGQKLEDKSRVVTEKITDAICYASAEIAHDLKAALIITATQTGSTALQVSKYRPPTPILAVTPDNKTVMKLKMAWGVYTAIIEPSKNIDNMFDKAIEAAKKTKMIKAGEKVVITAGVIVNIPGTTNLIKVQET